MVSSGGVHSLDNHIAALIKLIASHGIKRHYLHAFLDGRDVPPQSAASSLAKIQRLYETLSSGNIASLIGRYYAMDRDNRWNRIQIAYDLLTQGKAIYSAPTALDGLKAAYERQETDEFVSATTIHLPNTLPTTIEDGDIVIFMNFRADRARQLCYALTDAQFTHFKREKFPFINRLVTLTEYTPKLTPYVAYPTPVLKNTLGEFLAVQGLRQLRLAETEKYAHVTYFLNGGQEKPFANEERILVPSPKVATYDLQPEMSAFELTDRLIAAIESKAYAVIICNYANADMIGHTGIETAAKKAVEVIDICLKRVLEVLQKNGGEALITADHGNIEEIYDAINQQPHTAHTTNLVPFIYIGRPAQWDSVTTPSLDDVAPTLLYLLGLTSPPEMTGKNLLRLL